VLGRRGEEGLELVSEGGRAHAGLADGRNAPVNAAARDNAPREQGRLGAYAEDNLAGELLVQRLGRGGRLGQVGEGLLAAVLEQFRGEPDLQAA